MPSTLFHTILTSLSAPNTIIYLVTVLILLIYVLYLHYKMHTFTKGHSGASLESLMHTSVEHARRIQEENILMKDHAISLDTRVSHSLRNAQIIRYKALENGGSNQSFSIALLNERGDGIVITSLHVHDRINTFAKPVENYSSTFDLTDEEEKVVKDAKKAHTS